MYLPMFPLVRYLPKWAVTKGAADKESTACSKYFNTHTGLTPGVFTFFCPHDVCLGFKLMHKHEGPSTVHDTLFTRLQCGATLALALQHLRGGMLTSVLFVPDPGPAAIIYDNACNLHKYCVRRTPAFVAKTRFLIDRLHQYNHHRWVSCISIETLFMHLHSFSCHQLRRRVLHAHLASGAACVGRSGFGYAGHQLAGG